MSLDRVLYNFARRGVMPWMKGIVGSGPLSVDSQGRMISMDVGRSFYVAGNFGDDTNDGSSWDKAFKTFAAAITANNADVAADKYGWATRNRIYISGDTFEETLVAFPNKCDVIGVGSYDANLMAGITGNHAPVNAGNYGTRFINVHLKGAAVAGPIITLASTTSGLALWECLLDAPVSGTTNTIGVQATASPFLQIVNNKFRGPFSASFVTFGAGEAGGSRIVGNEMLDGADNGIVVNASTTTSWKSVIADNLIECADLTIDDNSDLFVIKNNILISGENVGASSYDFNVALASLNYLTGADKTSLIPALAAL